MRPIVEVKVFKAQESIQAQYVGGIQQHSVSVEFLWASSGRDYRVKRVYFVNSKSFVSEIVLSKTAIKFSCVFFVNDCAPKRQ